LRSGPRGLPRYMRRLLSGYASYFNRRHERHGHLFQSRYKSIVCEEDPYLMELVRYIHLNPLRAKAVAFLSHLEKHPWCGHGTILGRRERKWQDRRYVLKWFGSEERYAGFMKQGVGQGRRPELVGGGLIRSQGGWSAVKAMRRSGDEEKGDERILGGGEFVERLLAEAEEKVRRQLPTRELEKHANKVMEEICRKGKVSREVVLSGSRRKEVSRARVNLAEILVEELGVSLAECARRLGVTTSGVAQMLRRRA
jgi:putative transposase